MSEEQDKHGNPVMSGLVALLAVALTVGLVLAGVVLVATRMLGLGGDDAASADDTRQTESLYLPPPAKTTDAGPAVTLNTEPADDASEESEEAEESESTDKATKKPKTEIVLQAGQTAVGSFERIDLTGVYPGGEGATLQVQRFENGQWADFAATVPVSGETFDTYIQSAQTGVNRFRVVDNTTGEASNEVRVRVG